MLCLTDTSLYIYICVKHVMMADIKIMASPAETINFYRNPRSKLL